MLAMGFLCLSQSPFTAIFFLIFIALYISIKTAYLYSSWFFFSVLIIYVGGIIVIFLYLTRLISSFKIKPWKITLLEFRGLARVVIFLSPLEATLFTAKKRFLRARFHYQRCTLIFFLIFYLLIALILVFKLCQKQEGPLKRKTF